MIVYNLSIKVDTAVEKAWLQWQQEEHIPDVMASGQFTHYKFFRLLEQDETEGIVYIVQYFAASMDEYKRYIEQFAPLMREKVINKWGNKIIVFRTVMQVVN